MLSEPRGKILQSILFVYLYGSLHIGICAMAMSCQSHYLADPQSHPNPPLLLAILTGTVALYGFHRLTDIGKLKAAGLSEAKYIRIHQLRKPIRLISLISSLAGALFLVMLRWEFILMLAAGTLITILYSRTVITRLRKLREFSFLKIFLICIIWSVVTAGLPGIEANASWIILTLIFLERLSFIFALTLPFDLRDMEIDRAMGIKTIPMALGSRASLSLSLLILLICQPACWFFLMKLGNLPVGPFFALCISNIIISLFVWLSKRYQSDLYFYGILDGMMILQPAVLIIGII